MGNSQTYRPRLYEEPLEGGAGVRAPEAVAEPAPRWYYPDPVRNYRKGANQWGSPQQQPPAAGGYSYDLPGPAYGPGYEPPIAYSLPPIPLGAPPVYGAPLPYEAGYPAPPAPYGAPYPY